MQIRCALVGMPGSGKSTIGRQLAHRAGVPFIDLDHRLEQTIGTTIRSFFEAEGEARFRDLEHAYSATHLARLSDNTVQSIETSSLHIDLISELKRINSLLCSVAYPILESAGALAPSRLRAMADQA